MTCDLHERFRNKAGLQQQRRETLDRGSASPMVRGEIRVRQAGGGLSRGVHRTGRLLGPLRRVELIDHRWPRTFHVIHGAERHQLPPY